MKEETVKRLRAYMERTGDTVSIYIDNVDYWVVKSRQHSKVYGASLNLEVAVVELLEEVEGR